MTAFNKSLLFGGILSSTAALLHIAIIIGGPDWYRFFGAGEEMAVMAEKGSWYPAFITSIIALILFIWALYAFSGAGLIRRLPFLKTALVIISALYLIRGLIFIPIYFLMPQIFDAFLIWSSAICLIFGISYALGTKEIWPVPAHSDQ
ncbi:hypothetical protein MNBD_ALPHA03-2106 [hydrothermal vent metagenome]|uniref:DUF2569 domain-containing protein n=1 Tax=hydrothermal vent metagenome TaxID=652676 RepID=A0A3B1ARD1_9ZZZZ